MIKTKIIRATATMGIDLHAYYKVPKNWDFDKCMEYVKKQDESDFVDVGYNSGFWQIENITTVETSDLISHSYLHENCVIDTCEEAKELGLLK